MRQRLILGHNKERPKLVVYEAGSEAARFGKMSKLISLHEKDKEGEVAITS